MAIAQPGEPNTDSGMSTTDASAPLDIIVPSILGLATSSGPAASAAGHPTASAAEAPATSHQEPRTQVDLSDPIWAIEHVARTLHLSVDRAREFTYSAAFPAPRAGFGRNLWLRSQVLDWFERLPEAPRRAARTSPTRRVSQPRRATYTPRSPR